MRGDAVAISYLYDRIQIYKEGEVMLGIFRVYDTVEKKYADARHFFIQHSGELSSQTIGSVYEQGRHLVEWATGVLDSTGKEIHQNQE